MNKLRHLKTEDKTNKNNEEMKEENIEFRIMARKERQWHGGYLKFLGILKII